MTKLTNKMPEPEFLVFISPLVIGFLGAEVGRAAFYLAAYPNSILSDVSLCIKLGVILTGLLLCVFYSLMRGACRTALRMGRSLRFDLLVALGTGIWINFLSTPLLTKFHMLLKNTDSQWALAVLLLLGVTLFSSIVRQYRTGPQRDVPQLYFIADEEIDNKEHDLQESEIQAQSFADTVLASSAHSGLIFGIDGPWGIGKTSFINLAEHHWANAGDKVIVCRFEPLRYASESDLAERIIRDLSAAIQRKVFAPEFRPAASRYSRLIKRKADISFLGFKLSLEPNGETVDELLDNIDEVLKRIGQRVIIVIDDLDRLDAATINNVLFATRKTFKLTQATYVLCYDTEVLAENEEDGIRAREFLEKFVTVKLSLFVDTSSIRNFLQKNWQSTEKQFGLIPSDTMLKLNSILSELACILDENQAAKYLPLVGNLRKVKRFINATLILQLEKADLGRTDFNTRDLIHLILLHLYFPGVFRNIYAEESEGRLGIFSVKPEYGEREFKNSDEFESFVNQQPDTAAFLLKELFDVGILNLNDLYECDESELASRACFNHSPSRNLEKYLNLIVRFVTPEPQETFILYQQAVEQVRAGKPIASILTSENFRLEQGELSHDKFWRVLVNESNSFTRIVADNAIDMLINYLPKYSSIQDGDRGLRQRSIYSLLRLLDSAGWGRTSGRSLPNTKENVKEIAWRIFGENAYKGNGLINKFIEKDRGVIGWNDLMLFRLQCSADRQGQLHNLQKALITHQNEKAETTGLVSNLALMGMRKLSQEIFTLFKNTYIDEKRNFYADVDIALADQFLGSMSLSTGKGGSSEELTEFWFEQGVSCARINVVSFVIYQLSNSLPPKGSGVGCGYYDESGTADGGGIAKQMNKYVFDVCFNPALNEDNIIYFLDHCLSHLSNSFFSDSDEDKYIASKAGLSGGFDPREMGKYWNQYQTVIREKALQIKDRDVVTSNYIASYKEDLNNVFDVLDKLGHDVSVVKGASR